MSGIMWFIIIAVIIFFIGVSIAFGIFLGKSREGNLKAVNSEDDADAAKPKDKEIGAENESLVKVWMKKHGSKIVSLVLLLCFLFSSPYYLTFVWHSFPVQMVLVMTLVLTVAIVNALKSERSGNGATILAGLWILLLLINAYLYTRCGQEDNFLMWGYTYEKGKSQHQTIIDQTPKYEKYRSSAVAVTSDWQTVNQQQSGKNLLTIQKGEALKIKKGRFPLRVAGVSDEIAADTRECTIVYSWETEITFEFSGDKVWYKVIKT